MKKWIFMLLFVMGIWGIVPMSVKATSSTITFSTTNPQPTKGEEVTIICQVFSETGLTDADFYLSYDPKILKFKQGGGKVSGSNGELHISSTGNTDVVTTRTFSLQFQARKAGNTIVELSNSAKIMDRSGLQLSVSSNQLSIQVVKEKEEPEPTNAPALPTPKLSNNNKLELLEVQGVSMTPAFVPKESSYQIVVDCNTTRLMYHFQTASKKARVRVEGNENLVTGDNAIKIRVTSESGKKREYTLTVKKESEAETNHRLLQAGKAQSTGVAFQVNQLDGAVTLQNHTDFRVLSQAEIDKMEQIPSGYVATRIQIDGIEIPVYTMENDLENDFVLMYLEGTNGEKGLYQFDRKERTIQRYSGDMVEKVNKSGARSIGTGSTGSSNSTFVYVVIVILVLIILSLLITLLKFMAESKSSDKRR